MSDREHRTFADVLDELLCRGEIARGSWPKGMRLGIQNKSATISVLGRPPSPIPWNPRHDDLAATDWIIVTKEMIDDAA